MNTVIRHPLVRLAIVTLSLFVCLELLNSIIENWRRSDVVSERQAALVKEKERNKQLHEELREATSASFIEREARNKLGLVKEGDTMVLMGEGQKQAGEQVQNSQTPSSNLGQWWRLFF